MSGTDSIQPEQDEGAVYHLDRDDPRVEAAREAERRAYDHYGVSFSEHFVEVPTFDSRMRVLEVGDGPPVVMVIGGEGIGVGWLPLLPELAGYTLYVLDRPGGGLSDGLDYRSIPLREQAIPATTALFDQFGIDTAPLVGSSNGGGWSLAYAMERPDRVSKLGLIGCPVFFPGFRVPVPMRLMGLPRIGKVLIERLMRPDGPDAVEDGFEMMGHPSDTIEALPEAYLEAWYRMDALPHYTWSWATLLERATRIWRRRGFDPDLAFTPAELGDISVPVMFIWGPNDAFGSPDEGRTGAEYIPDAEFHEVGTGHLTWLDDPERTGALLRGFLDRQD